MVVAQLAERSLPTPVIRGSNPDIGNISNMFICQLLSRKDENKEKEAGMAHFLKKTRDLPIPEIKMNAVHVKKEILDSIQN